MLKAYFCTSAAAILKDSNFNEVDRADCQFSTTATTIDNGSQVCDFIQHEHSSKLHVMYNCLELGKVIICLSKMTSISKLGMDEKLACFIQHTNAKIVHTASVSQR